MSDTKSVYTGTQINNPSRRAGVAYITIDGESFDIADDATYKATNVTREGLTGQSGTQGYSEMPAYPYIKAKLRDAGNMTVALFMAKTSSTVNLVLANGKQVAGDNMFCQECTEVATKEASFEVTFMGNTVDETPL